MSNWRLSWAAVYFYVQVGYAGPGYSGGVQLRWIMLPTWVTVRLLLQGPLLNKENSYISLMLNQLSVDHRETLSDMPKSIQFPCWSIKAYQTFAGDV